MAAPDCFIIEQKLKELLDIPIFHDDQHGPLLLLLQHLSMHWTFLKRRLIKEELLLMEQGLLLLYANLFKSTGVKVKTL